MEAFKLSLAGVVSSFPLIIFSYMQQIGVSMIYSELKGKSYEKMSRVVASGTVFVTFFYLMIGIFGYATFLGPPINHELCSQNILSANFNGSKLMVLGNFALLLSVGLATPIDLLPCKNSIEDLFFKEKRMSKW